MKTTGLRLLQVTLLLSLLPVTVLAQDARVEELERTLHERDKVIAELLERVEALERRVGVQRPAREIAGASKPDIDPDDPATTAPGAVVVEEGSAERALERSLTQEGSLLLTPGLIEFEPGFTYSRREDTAPSLVTSGGGFLAGELERNADSLTANLAMRLGLPRDSQIEVALPYRWRQVESVTSVDFAPATTSKLSGSGAGDFRIGLSKTLLREGLRRPDLIGRITWDSHTGATRSNGLAIGGGFDELQGSLTAIKRQDPIAFVGGLSYDYVFEKDLVQPGPTISANFGSFIALSPETSLRFLFNAAWQDETELAGNRIDGSDRTIGTLVVGGSTLLAPGKLLSLSVGIGLTDDADDFSISLSLPIRFDKPLF